MRRTTRSVRWVAACAAIALVACSESDPVEVGTTRDALVVEQVIRELAGDPPEPEALPVVFVVGADGNIGIEVQAGVAGALVDDIEVRFADERIEAIDEGPEERPVRDDGVLLVVQDIPPEGETIDVQVDRYEFFEDGQRMVVTLEFVEPDWRVVDAVELEPPET